MSKYVFAVLLLLCHCPLFGQQEMLELPISNESPFRDLGNAFSIGDTARVFGDKINVRSTAQSNGTVVAQLAIGDEVRVLDTAQFWQLNGIDERWLKVSFLKNGTRQEGFVWSGLLALGFAEIDGTMLLFGQISAEKPKEEGEFGSRRFECRAARSGAGLASAKFEASVSQGYYVQTAQLPNLGYTKFRGGLKVNLGFGACGYANFESYFFWDGQKLTVLPTLESVADGGVFYHSETYVFPFQQDEYLQEKQAILLKTEHMEVISGDFDELESDEWTKIRVVKWDGRQFVKPKVD